MEVKFEELENSNGDGINTHMDLKYLIIQY